jgi:hypothetical protein
MPELSDEEWDLVLNALVMAGSLFKPGSPSERRMFHLLARICAERGIDAVAFLMEMVEAKEKGRGATPAQ